MGQNRRPGSGTPRDGHKAMNGIIAPPGTDFAALPSNAAAVKAEASHAAIKAKSGTPPPPEQGPLACQMERNNSQRAPEAPPGPSPEAVTLEQQRAAEDRLLEAAAKIAALRAQLSLAFGRPQPEPGRAKTHWDYLLEEMQWLHVDFAQERLWKRAAARAMGMAAAAAARKGGLRKTPAGDKMRAEIVKATARETETKTKRERASSSRNANAHIADGPLSCLDLEGALGPDTPPLRESRSLTYFTDETLQEKVERHLHELVEADVIQRLQEEREWEQEVEDARRAQLESREAKRAKEEAEDPAEAAVDDEEAIASLRNKRRKKAGRLNMHIMDDFVEMDDSQDGGDTPVAMRPGANRRPTAMLRPLSGTSDRQLSDVEQRAQRKKRARRDFEDEDYEEPAQPRRVSARRQAAAEAQAQARKGMLRSQPSDKRKLGQKGMQRIDSMQFGGLRRGSGMAGSGQSMPWSEAEDRLLCAIVHEFGSNWFLVADVLSASCAMQGIYRSPTTCRYRFRNLTATHGQGVELEPSEEMALAAMQIDKQSARQLLNSSLPVPSDVLMGHQKALAQIATKAHHQRIHEEMRAGQAASMRTEPHPSFQNVMSGTLAANKGQFMAPAQLAELAEAQIAAQAAQHAAVQQAAAAQAAQAAQAAALPPAAPMAGPPMSPAQLAQQPFAPPMSMGQPLANGNFQGPAAALGPPQGAPPGTPGAEQHAQSAAAGMPPVPPGQQPPNGQAQLPAQPAAPGAAGQPPAGVGQPSPASSAMQQPPQQPQQQGAPAQQPMGSHAGMPGSPAPLQAPGAPPGPAAQQMRPPQMLQGQSVSQAQAQAAQQQRNSAQVAQLQSILAANQMPDGRALTDDVRNQIIARLTQVQRAPIPGQRGIQQPMQMTPAAMQAAQNSMAARLQQQQQQQMPQGGARGLPGMLAGMPPNMAMRPHMGGFPNGPNGLPQMPQVRPQQPGMPSQMMPPGMVPPQMPPGGLPNLPGLLAAQSAAGPRPSGSST